MLVVGSFDELAARAGEAEGRIVLFDVPFTSYGETVPYRVNGATAAAQVLGLSPAWSAPSGRRV